MIPKLYMKLIAGGIIAILIGVFIASWLARGREIDRLASWQQTVVDTTTLATVEPDAKGQRKLLTPEQVPGAIAALKQSFVNADQLLAAIDQAALKDAAISDKLDANLASILEDQARRSAGVNATISALLNRKPSGDKTLDCEAMASDSEAAWNGWRN